jgi:murein L,D-transpeptidase YafK
LAQAVDHPSRTCRRVASLAAKERAWALACVIAGGLLTSGPANAFRIELNDVAPDRIERQRAEAIGQIPFPGTPNIAQFEQRLKDKGLAVGAPMFIRVFKAENELEVWLRKGERFELFATYPMCHWSGTLGPKISEGDKQAPEGVYTVNWKQLHMVGRHPRTLNLGFPNAYDRQFQRTGSFILIHGGCGSVGCYAMTNPVIEEIFSLAQAAIKGGQEAIHVHAFPFRLTEAKLQAYALNEWYDFWRNLKDVHDQFDRTRRVPKVTVCEGRYWLDPDDGEVASQSPLAVCGAPQGVASRNSPMVNAASPTRSSSLLAQSPQLSPQPVLPWSQRPSAPPARSWVAPIARVLPTAVASNSQPAAPQPTKRQPATASPSPNSNPQLSRTKLATEPVSAAAVGATCQPTLPSCRKWMAQQQAMLAAARRVTVAQSGPTSGPTSPRPAPTRR